jgi:hypothetical protein
MVLPGAVLESSWEDIEFVVPLKYEQIPWMDTGDLLPTSYSDPHMYSPGYVMMFVSGQGLTSNIGALFVEYTVEFRCPRLNANLNVTPGYYVAYNSVATTTNPVQTGSTGVGACGFFTNLSNAQPVTTFSTLGAGVVMAATPPGYTGLVNGDRFFITLPGTYYVEVFFNQNNGITGQLTVSIAGQGSGGAMGTGFSSVLCSDSQVAKLGSSTVGYSDGIMLSFFVVASTTTSSVSPAIVVLSGVTANAATATLGRLMIVTTPPFSGGMGVDPKLSAALDRLGLLPPVVHTEAPYGRVTVIDTSVDKYKTAAPPAPRASVEVAEAQTKLAAIRAMCRSSATAPPLSYCTDATGKYRLDVDGDICVEKTPGVWLPIDIE